MNYQNQIKNLVKKYNLNYTFNPGGAQFHSKNFEYNENIGTFVNNCQIMAYDDKEDLEKLEKWLVNYPKT